MGHVTRNGTPFLEAIDKMSEFWRDRHIDTFKDGVSVPGLTMKDLFSNIRYVFLAIYRKRQRSVLHNER